MPQVLNVRKVGRPKGAIYCGRPGPWGNPFEIGKPPNFYTREEVIALHKAACESDPVFMALIREKLRGKDLLCFCAPLACHCDFYLEVANA